MGQPRHEQLVVGIAQVAVEAGAPERNLARHLDMIADARERNVNCLIFPELSLTGPLHDDGPLQIALHRHHPWILKLAKASGPMATTFGLIEEGKAAQFYNAAYTVGGGVVLHIHRKINLATVGPTTEVRHVAPGRYVETYVSARPWRTATLIGNDFWNPALVHLASLHGAALIALPVSSANEAHGAPFDTPGGWDLLCRSSAMVYGLPIAFANRVGRGPLTFWGRSRVVDATGATIAEASDDEGLLVAELAFEAVRATRAGLPTARDSSLDLVVREVNRLHTTLGVPDHVRRE